MSTFARKVVEIVKAIPAGETRSYGQVAEEAGSPNAARAVGAILIPLHEEDGVPWWRVVLSDGTVRAAGDGDPNNQWAKWARNRLTDEGVAFTNDGRVRGYDGQSSGGAGGAGSRSPKRPDPSPCWKHETIQHSCRDCG